MRRVSKIWVRSGHTAKILTHFSLDNASVNMDKVPRIATVVSIFVNSASLGIFDQLFLSLLSTALYKPVAALIIVPS